MSGCFNALQKVATWTPGPAAAGPIKVIIGLLKNAPQKFSTMLVQGNRIVLHGSLDTLSQVNQFKTEVMNKVNGSPAVHDLDRVSLRIVVPCPPPRVVLTPIELSDLNRAVNTTGADLSDVFT